MGHGVLRVVDFGWASPLRSQTLWHAVAYGVSECAPPTLSFVRPSRPYVSIGRLRELYEVDLGYCRRARLPVYRRMVGGGPVYLDDDQLFFQITVPEGWVSPCRAEALRWLLRPAVEAFRAQGVAADLDPHPEIVVGDRKICGHAGGQIGEAAVVVGNLIQRFPHHRAARILHVPHPQVRATLLRLMRRYVAATPVDPERFKEDLVRAYSRALGLPPEPGGLCRVEWERVEVLDRLFLSPDWLRGAGGGVREAWQVKVRAGVWVCAVEEGGGWVVAAVAHGRLDSLYRIDGRRDGTAPAADGRLEGVTLEQATRLLESSGGAGARLAAALSRVASLAS